MKTSGICPGDTSTTSEAVTMVLVAQFLLVLHERTLAWYLWLWRFALTFVFAFWMSYEVFMAGEIA